LADPSSVSIVIPALDEAATIGTVVSELHSCAAWHEIIVVDDGSADGTGEAARAAGARVVRHPYNKGNGAAVKSGIRSASGPYVLILDGDGQHAPGDAVEIVRRLGDYDLVIAARTPETQATYSRRLGNALLNRLAAYVTARPIPDLTSGFRAARRDSLQEFLYLLPNGFSTPTTTTLAFIRAGYSVTFHPVAAGRRTGRSKIHFARDGAKFLLILLKIATLFSPLRIFGPLSLVPLLVGALYAVWNVVFNGRIPNGAVILILFAALVFLVGLVSEQVAALRYSRRPD
jgi:glycosyltransferase involved in cell wall biosynthesis